MNDRAAIQRLSEEVIIVRPTLLVGLGGTGVLILRQARQALIELLDAVPPFIKFLALDTDDQEEAEVPKLPESDFFNLFDTPYMQLGEVLRGFARNPMSYPHLSWLTGMTLDSSYVGRGCQGLSRLGRVVFCELRDTVIRREVMARFDALNTPALSDQVENFAPKKQFAIPRVKDPIIHISASICGGTGTGFLLDSAYNLRWWSNEVFGRTADVVAHLMLPEAFYQDGARTMDKFRAVAATMLEQIELLTDGRREGDLWVRYRNGVLGKMETTLSPFSFCYLLSSGGIQRAELSKMMGRMIRTMCAEPASQHIFADGNNKQLDILSHYERQNKGAAHRRLLLASYGLQCGTPGAPTRLEDGVPIVRQWICKTLSDMTAIRPAIPGDWDKRIADTIAPSLDLDELAAQMPNLEDFPSPKLPDATAKEEAVKQLGKLLDGLCDKRMAEAKALMDGRMREVHRFALEMVREVVLDTPELSPVLIHALFDLWSKRLLEKRASIRQHTPPQFHRVREEIQKAAREALEERSKETILATEDCWAIVLEALQSGRHELDKVFLVPRRDPLLGLLGKLFGNIAKALKDLAQQARKEAGHDSGHPGTADSNGAIAPFTHTLFDLEHPHKNSAPASDSADRQRRDDLMNTFNEKLIRPILKPFTTDKPPVGDDQLTAKEYLTSALAGVDGPMKAFLSEYCDDLTTRFHERLGNEAPEDHWFDSRLKLIIGETKPMIDVNKDRSFTEPMEVTIAQMVRNTCVPDLTKVDRSAWVLPYYEEKTDIWVQFMKLSYGFSLEALKQWKDYKEARNRYLEDAGFQAVHLWLDPRWYNAYQTLLAKCACGPAPTTASAGAAANIKDRAESLQVALCNFTSNVEMDITAPSIEPDKLRQAVHLYGAFSFQQIGLFSVLHEVRQESQYLDQRQLIFLAGEKLVADLKLLVDAESGKHLDKHLAELKEVS